MSDSIPLFIGADQLGTSTADVSAGVVHLGIPFDDGWTLSVDGTSVEPRRAFGETTAYDTASTGVGSLRYDTSSLRIVPLSGSAIPAGMVERWMDEFGDNLYNLYGST